MQRSLISIIRFSGFRCLLEEYGLSHSSINPSKSRPDISILNPGTLATDLEVERGTKKILIGVSITKNLTVPISSEAQPSLTDARNPGLSTISVYQRKWNQYSAMFAELKKNDNFQKLGIIPFIAQTTGFIHNRSKLLLKHLADHASHVNDIPKSVIYHRFQKIVSCALQRGLGDAVSVRYSAMNNTL